MAPPAFTGQQILDQLNALEPDPERRGYFKGYNSKHAWTHKPCFWDLPYFKDLLLPHNIDMMHTEKNIGGGEEGEGGGGGGGEGGEGQGPDRKSTRLNSSHRIQSRMPSSA